MKWEIEGPSHPGFGDYPVRIKLILEDDNELADFYARINIVGTDQDGDVKTALLLAQDIDLLPEPDDEIFQDFFEDLEDFVRDMIREDEDV